MAEPKRDQTQVVESENMVGVLMGVDDRVDQTDPFADQLDPQIRRGVDQHRASGQPDRDRTAGAVVPRIVALTNLAIASDRRDADAGPGAQEGDQALVGAAGFGDKRHGCGSDRGRIGRGTTDSEPASYDSSGDDARGGKPCDGVQIGSSTPPR